VAAVCLTINAALNFLLMVPLKVGGIALASAIAGTIDFLALFYIMNKRLGGLNSGLLRYFIKVAVAGIAMGVFASFIWDQLNFSIEIINLCLIGVFSVVFYEIAGLILKIDQAEKIWEWVKSVSRGS